MFGDNSHGFSNEKDIAGYINKVKLFDEMNVNLKSFLTFLFQRDLSGTHISSNSIKRNFKPDIVIEAEGEERYVSVKTGSGNSVHQEKLSIFESFLSSCLVPTQTVNYLKEFHYADGTTNGSGATRLELKNWIKLNNNSGKVNTINNDLNEEIILPKLIDRFLFVGNLEKPIVADAVYHGNVSKGSWASRSEIMTYLLSNSIKLSSSKVHFSSLSYQVWNRNLKFNPDTENRRHVMQVKWPTLESDIDDIRRLARTGFNGGNQNVQK